MLFSLIDNLLLREERNGDRPYAEQLLKKFGLYDKICAAPQGLDNDLTREFRKDGLVLSTGEQQKLAIIRALMNPVPILIMDEPSSAIDPISESQIFKTVMQESGNRTVVFISHRLSATQYADKIYVFDNGAICESGTHERLLAKQGIYANLWKKQAENYRKLEEYG